MRRFVWPAIALGVAGWMAMNVANPKQDSCTVCRPEPKIASSEKGGSEKMKTPIEKPEIVVATQGARNNLAALAKDVVVHRAPTYAERWSDHAPVVATFDL